MYRCVPFFAGNRTQCGGVSDIQYHYSLSNAGDIRQGTNLFLLTSTRGDTQLSHQAFNEIEMRMRNYPRKPSG